MTTPKANDWSDPLVRANTFLDRMLRLCEEVSKWQGKCAILRHENNRLRAKIEQLRQLHKP